LELQVKVLREVLVLRAVQVAAVVVLSNLAIQMEIASAVMAQLAT
jgi:hypothetical protein